MPFPFLWFANVHYNGDNEKPDLIKILSHVCNACCIVHSAHCTDTLKVVHSSFPCDSPFTAHSSIHCSLSYDHWPSTASFFIAVSITFYELRHIHAHAQCSHDTPISYSTHKCLSFSSILAALTTLYSCDNFFLFFFVFVFHHHHHRLHFRLLGGTGNRQNGIFLQKRVPDNQPFPCRTAGHRSRIVPTSVHQLRPGKFSSFNL